MIEGLLLTLAISIAGGLGAVLRHTVDVAVQVRSADGRSGTFVVNVSGSFVLGLVVGLVPDHPWGDVLGVGLLGGYTTFSTAMLQVVQSFGEQDGVARVRAGSSAVTMLLACVAAAALGVLVVSLVGAGR